MKLFKKSMAIVVLAIVATLSVNCSSDSSSSSSDSGFYLKCKINGVQFVSTDPYVINSLSKSITAQSDNENIQETVSLYMPLTVATGTYTITEEPSNVDSYGAGYSNFDTDVSSQEAAGTLTITQVTADVIKGTFSFTSPDFDGNTITVTEGTFRAENIQ
ncbi:DUF6252 family protein [Flavobacterium capsici]|uniref:DUF6252 family protein n=1 Tax=Flavobacterium capsici TaxID=3075618 RepID=A0AA96F3G8_9FLAO|nr:MULTISPECIES: DUF6252 family protein [unclassified Flavobacterium]WNM17985.1 DUF6252 family protein [Flavobacterium sp. PMR2A8]WNM22037.1 DUF6252 family protein [Flavobacterium sp. PMTSA4]